MRFSNFFIFGEKMEEEDEKDLVVEAFKSKDRFVSYLHNQGVFLIEFPEKLIGELSYKELTLKDAETKKDFQKNKDYNPKKIKIEITATSTFAVNYLLDFLKLCKKVNAEKVKLEVGNNTPIKMTACNHNDEEVLRFWLAPVIRIR